MSAAGAPGIELLESAVVAQLAKVQIANGYKSDVQKVFRVPVNMDQPTEGAFPCFVVVPASNGDEFTQGDEHYKARMSLVIGGMINMGQADLFEADRVTALNWLMEDAINACLEDPSF